MALLSFQLAGGQRLPGLPGYYANINGESRKLEPGRYP